MRIWPSHFAKPYIYVLFPKSKNALSSLREYLDLDDDSILNHSYSEEFDIPYLQNIINIVKPKGIFWWGWPPGQWLSHLLCEVTKNYSVSFKYDFPTAGNFKAHLYSCGSKYGKLVESHRFDLVPLIYFLTARILR